MNVFKVFGLFRQSIFRNFFFASLASFLGEGIVTLTIIVVTLKESNSVMSIGYMLILTILPSAILGPIIGALIDKTNKAKLSIICSILRAVTIVLLPISMYLGFFNVFVLYLSIFLSYIAWYILMPTLESIIKDVIDEDNYLKGVSFLQAAWQVGMLMAGLLAGSVMNIAGVELTLMIASVTYIVGAIFFYKIYKVFEYKPISKIGETHSIVQEYFTDIKEGLNYLKGNKKILFFSLTSCIVLPFFYAINILLAPFNYQMVTGNEFTLGFIDSGAGIGSLLSAAFCLIISSRKKISFYLLCSLLLLGGSTVIFSMQTQYFMAFICYIVLGFFIGNVKVLSKSIIYKYVNQKYIGRTMGTISMTSLVLTIIYTLLIGYLGDISVHLAYLITSLSLLVPALFCLLGKVLDDRQIKVETEINAS